MKLEMPLWCKLFHHKPVKCIGPHRWKCGNCDREWGKGYKYEDVRIYEMNMNGRLHKAYLFNGEVIDL